MKKRYLPQLDTKSPGGCNLKYFFASHLENLPQVILGGKAYYIVSVNPKSITTLGV
jgi:hypothetical protein